MDWPLAQLVKDSEDVASGLQIFLDEVPSKATDISSCMSELFGISSALRALDHALDFTRYGRFSGRITSDADLVLGSLQYTLKEVIHMFAQTGRSGYTPGAFPDFSAYNLLWDDLSLDMKDEGMALCTRLKYYHSFIANMLNSLHHGSSSQHNNREMEQIRVRLQRLLRKQEPLDARLERLDLDPRPRTPGPPGPLGPPPPPPALSAPPVRPMVQTWYSYPSTAYPPQPLPAAPEVPLSPTSSSSSGNTYYSSRDTYIGSNSTSSSQFMHWATYIFDGQHPVSPLLYYGEPTKCWGRDEPKAVRMLQDDGFMCVLELPFEGTNVWVRLYWRPSDHRSRILYLNKDRGRKNRFCIPLTALKIRRSDSTLQLCRINPTDGAFDLWANLKFTCYERMVLFYCTFVALKKQDWVQIPQGLEDLFQQGGEEQEFGGEIEDDRYLHAFRIFRDKDSGAVRFEASARRGPMIKCPIWTAFVTSYIGSRSWMRRISSTTVQLRELKPYVFCDNYQPHRGPSGKFELNFTTKSDADEFVETFQMIKLPR